MLPVHVKIVVILHGNTTTSQGPETLAFRIARSRRSKAMNREPSQAAKPGAKSILRERSRYDIRLARGNGSDNG